MPDNFNFVEGEVLLIDKPIGWTSFDVVNKVRIAIRNYLRSTAAPGQEVSGKLKVGHAGTLDPLASGLLILCTGKFTKRIDEFMAQEKEYTGTITFGYSTPSYDAETEADHKFPTDHLNESEIRAAAEKFVGEIEQLPPIFSAIKIDGKKLYELARAGKSAELTPRKIFIESFELNNFDLPNVDFKVVCSKGTYIRSLAHDLGKSLDNGATLTALRRTRIGEFKIDQALGVIDFVKKLEENYKL